jgi:hypothetical protein
MAMLTPLLGPIHQRHQQGQEQGMQDLQLECEDADLRVPM